MGVCLATALGSAVLATNAFTLAWTHSIEKIRWEEAWIVREGRLHLETARIMGHGAGMEPPAGAVLRDGVWQWHPRTVHERLHLARSGFTADFEVCVPGASCRPMEEILPTDGGVTDLWSCEATGAVDGDSPDPTGAVGPSPVPAAR